ncbi:hypothetical protein G7084_04835 [Weissella coleopterorum]|uniref:DNA-directed RNA polymerase beta subunit n=1 Tax=Weissella coleopterorum TaxID=2714949 RepID=A0A6G8B059_9LACO|nr:hypothetical protein [Weissella coleopterorum]QIL50698.1 hypothetical protein G7084_04835 [Weissella coleopterorum]
MVKMKEAQMERAKHFFENEYQERGMVKWQGYYLSDHTENVLDYTQQRQNKMNQKLMPGMSQEDISKVLFSAYAKKHSVSVQGKEIVDDLVPAIISGMVKGYDEDNVYIGSIRIPLESINWIQEKQMKI